MSSSFIDAHIDVPSKSSTAPVHSLQDQPTNLSASFNEELRQTVTSDVIGTEHKAATLSPHALKVAESLHDRGLSIPVLAGSIRLLDGFLILATGFLAATQFPGLSGISMLQVIGLLLGPVIGILLLQATDSYQVPVMRSALSQITRGGLIWTIFFGILAAGLLNHQIAARVPAPWLATWYLAGLVCLTTSRTILAFFVRRWIHSGRLERRAVIVGGGQTAAELIRDLESQGDTDIHICGIFDDRSNDRSPPIVAGYPKLGNIDALVEFARQARIDMLIVCIPLTARERVLELLKKLWVLPLDIRFSMHSDNLRFRSRPSSFIGTVPFVDVVAKPITDWDQVSKRIFDLVFASLALLCLWPVMLITAIAVKLDSSGPILFRQKRYGFNNEIIEVLKFRTMYADQTDANARKLVTRNDPRVTRIGKYLRQSSIDELPQLLNVLGGSLSLVGPRPHALMGNTAGTNYDQVVSSYYVRHKVKPGVTGWAQINGWRGETDTAEKIRKRVEFDLYYIENWSLLMDLRILIRTPFCLFNTKQAY